MGGAAMTLEFLVHSALAGFIATYLLMVFAQTADRFGLPRVDFAHEQAELVLRDVVKGPSAYFIGLMILHMNGIIFALLYSTVAQKYLPGVPGYPIVPAIFIIVMIFMGVFAFTQWRSHSLISLGSIIAGIPVFYVWSWIRGRSRTG